MSVYFVAVVQKVRDAELQCEYGRRALPHIMETPNAVELAAAFRTSGEAGRIYELTPQFKSMGIKKFETIEGDPADGLVIIKFDDRKDFENWYYSERYQEYLHFRKEAADAQVFLIEGFE